MTPGKNKGTWSTILRKQSYLKGIPAKELRPSTLKGKETTPAGTNPAPAKTPAAEPQAQPPGL